MHWTFFEDMPLDVTWNDLHLDALQDGRTIVAKSIFSTVAIDKCIREPAWVEELSVDGIPRK